MAPNFSKNAILKGPVDFFCLACEAYLTTVADTEGHVTNAEHMKNLALVTNISEYKDDCIMKIRNRYFCELCNKLFSVLVRARLHITEPMHIENKLSSVIKRCGEYIVAFDKMVIEKESWNGLCDGSCIICDAEYENEETHINLSSHILNLIQTKIEFDQDKNLYRKIDESTFHCLTCNTVQTLTHMNKHFDSLQHISFYRTFHEIYDEIMKGKIVELKIHNKNENKKPTSDSNNKSNFDVTKEDKTELKYQLHKKNLKSVESSKPVDTSESVGTKLVDISKHIDETLKPNENKQVEIYKPVVTSKPGETLKHIETSKLVVETLKAVENKQIEIYKSVDTLKPDETLKPNETLKPVNETLKAVENKQVDIYKPVETSKLDETLKPNETLKLVDETLKAVENKPVKTSNPVETLKPVEISRPVETSMPVETQNPVEISRPVETLNPAETLKLVEISRPVEISKSVEVSNHDESSKAVRSLKHVKTSKCIESSKPIKTSKPVEVLKPIARVSSDTYKEGNPKPSPDIHSTYEYGLQDEKKIFKMLKANNFIAKHHKNETWCILCDWIMEQSKVSEHLQSKHHQELLKMHTQRQQQLKNTYAKHYESQLQYAMLNKSNILNAMTMFRQNHVEIDNDNDKAYCKQCLVDLEFDHKVIHKHILEHNTRRRYIQFEVSTRRGESKLLSKPMLYNVDKAMGSPRNVIDVVCRGSHNSLKNCNFQVDLSARKREEELRKISLGLYVKSTIPVDNLIFKDLVINDEVCINRFSYCFIAHLVDNVTAKCYACRENVLLSAFEMHIQIAKHEDIFDKSLIIDIEQEFIREIQPTYYHCGFCNICEISWENMETHLLTAYHRECKISSMWRLQQYQAEIAKGSYQKTSSNEVLVNLFTKK